MVDRLNSKYVDGLSNKVQANVKFYIYRLKMSLFKIKQFQLQILPKLNNHKLFKLLKILARLML